MELIHRYRYILAGITVLAIALFLRDGSTGRFRYDAARWAEPSYLGANAISVEEIASLPGEKLIVAFNSDDNLTLNTDAIKTVIPADSILSRKYRKIIRSHKGAVLLYDSDISVSARVWMVLSQTGHENIYIIDPAGSNESLKEKIVPDPPISQP